MNSNVSAYVNRHVFTPSNRGVKTEKTNYPIKHDPN